MIKRNLKDFPKVWRTFEKTTKNGELKQFKVQDITDDMFEDVASLMIKHYLTEEPFSIAADTLTDHDALKKTLDFWKYKLLPQRLSLVCLEYCNDDKTRLVGVNFINYIKKGQKAEGLQEADKMVKMLDYIYSKCDIFETFQVDEYLTDCGCVVNPEYRGMNIGVELFHAREPLCKELGVRLCETIFSVPASQAMALKAGYETLLDVEYEEIERMVNVKFPEGSTHMKMMTRMFD